MDSFSSVSFLHSRCSHGGNKTQLTVKINGLKETVTVLLPVQTHAIFTSSKS